MNEIRKVFHFREISIAIVIALSMFITGLCLDWNLTTKLYDPINTNWFGILLTGMGEIPVAIGAMIAGVGLVVARRKKPVWLQVIMIVLGIIAMIVGSYFVFDNAKDWASFKNTEDKKTLFTILAIVFTLLVSGLTIGLTFLFTRKSDKELLLKISIIIIAASLIAVLFGNVFKYFWGRQRPRSAFVNENPADFFNPWWSIHPFRPLIEKFKNGAVSNDYKSFPSGHTLYGALGMLTFPLLTLLNEKTRNMRWLQIVLFYVALGWTFLTAISRVVAGAHYLSDTACGMLLTVLTSILTVFIGSKTLKEHKLLEEDVQA